MMLSDKDAFSVLARIVNGDRVGGADDDRWLKAFETVRWATKIDTGWVATATGREALNAFLAGADPSGKGSSEPGLRPDRV